MTTYSIVSTEPTIYQNGSKQIVNGVLVRILLTDYNEVHEVRVPSMSVEAVKAEADRIVKERDALAALGTNKKG